MSVIEKSWIKKLKLNNNDCWIEFEVLFKAYIYGILNRYRINKTDADDVYQTVVLKCLNNFDKFKYEINESGLKKWLGQITTNTAINYYHHNKLIDQKKLEYLSLKELEYDHRIENLNHDNMELLINLWREVSFGLEESHKEIFECFLRGQTAKEIAKKHSINLYTVYKIRKRTIKKLLTILKKKNLNN